MTSIIFNQGLGLTDSSLNQLSGHFNGGTAGIGQGGVNHYVNAATGNLVLTDHDEILVGKGVDIVAQRTYNSQGEWNDSDRNGWRFGFERKLVLGADRASQFYLVLGDGNLVQYQYNSATQQFEPKEGEGTYHPIRLVNNQYVWRNLATGAEDAYDQQGRLIRSEDADGQARTYEYDNGKLTYIRFENSQEAMKFGYHNSGPGNGKLASLSTIIGDKTIVQVEYDYNTDGRLATVRTALLPETGDSVGTKVYSTDFTYDGDSNRIVLVKQSDGTEVHYKYDNNRVSKVTIGSGDDAVIYDYDYDPYNDTTTITDNLKRVWTYEYDSKDRLTKTIAPEANADGTWVSRTTEYRYDADDNLELVMDSTDPENPWIQMFYTYDDLGNRTTATDAEGNRTQWIYDEKRVVNEIRGQVDIQFTTPEGDNLVDIGPSSRAAVSIEQVGTDVSGYLSKTLVTRQVYDDEQHLRFTISAEGRVTEYKYNTPGQRTAILRYGGRAYDVSGLAASATLDLATMTQWTGQQDKSQLQRVDYHYDGRDQLRETIQYATVDADGNGVGDTRKVNTVYTYDQQGLLLQEHTTRNGKTESTTYTYDGMNRRTKVTNNQNHSIITDYRGNEIEVTTEEGKLTTSTYDTVGRLQNQVVTGAGISQEITHYYDEAGRLYYTSSNLGNDSYTFYDAQGRVVGQMDTYGTLTETVYNDRGQVVETVEYWNRYGDIGTLLVKTGGEPTGLRHTSLDQLRPESNADKDRHVRFTYDDAGRLVSQTDGEGTRTQTVFDDYGRTEQTRVGSRRQTFIYNDDNQQVATLDAEGYLVEHVYNHLGQKIADIAYANKAQRRSGTLEQMRPESSNQDRLHYTFYDGMGRVVAEVTPTGTLIETLYDHQKNTVEVRRYHAQLTMGEALLQQSPSDLVETLTAAHHAQAGSGASVYVSTVTQYNDLGQVESVTDENQIKTEFKYNGDGIRNEQSRAGQVVTTEVNAFGLTDSVSQGNETVSYRYDAEGRKVATEDGRGNLTIHYYDQLGREVLAIDPRGQTLLTVYDAFGQAKSTQKRRLNTEGTSWAGGLYTAEVAQQVETQTVHYQATREAKYNRRGQEVYRRDNEGITVSTDYNSYGEVSRVTETRNQSGSMKLITDYKYDRRGQVIETQQRDSLVRQAYDAFGNVVTVINVGDPSQSSWLNGDLYDDWAAHQQTTQTPATASGQIQDGSSLSEIATSNNDTHQGVAVSEHLEDRVSRSFYDNAGQLRFTVNSLGEVIEQEYDSAGRVTRVIRYAAGQAAQSGPVQHFHSSLCG